MNPGKSTDRGGGENEVQKKSGKEGLPFEKWEAVLFQACSEFLVAIFKIKLGIFPTPLSTGDWTPISTKVTHAVST